MKLEITLSSFAQPPYRLVEVLTGSSIQEILPVEPEPDPPHPPWVIEVDLFKDNPHGLIEMLTGSTVKEVVEVKHEVKPPSPPDLVVRLQDGGLYHLKLQSEPDEKVIWQMLYCYSLIRQCYPQQPSQQLLYIGPGVASMDSKVEMENLSFSYDIADIKNIDCHLLLESDVITDNVLAILCRLPEDETPVIQQILHRISQLEEETRQDMLERLHLLATLRSNKLQHLLQSEING